MTSRLGTQLRRLVELLDGDLEAIYRAQHMSGYRPRYTPVVRALQQLGPATIKRIAEYSGTSHSAASQTVAQMQRGGLVTTHTGLDARERLVSMTPALRKLIPKLQLQWQATSAAATDLEEEIGIGLSGILDTMIRALEEEPFSARIERHIGQTKGKTE
ncbi:MarR family winged helix-turn-helix transcriptional regulator [Gilvimarinus sp. F26214L]|uniref:MarR family winged helix-turn-helix transcriptional regulator n=1 Tax=Gilvimarinus sp. DZF01 TaxID=3461371 RepID=UPI00404597CA